MSSDPTPLAGRQRPLPQAAGAATLKRSLSLWHVVLYGLGVTIGAGIYVLVGATAGRAGVYAPFAFVIAAAVMVPTALSFAELSGRMPVSAGEAAFVREGFGSNHLALAVGLMVIAIGLISAAAITVGAAGYVAVFVPAPMIVLIPSIVLAMGAIAAWGIVESVTLAAIMTVIEITGLAVIVIAGLLFHPGLAARLPEIVPMTADPAAWSGILDCGLIAFFAFIGFEGIVNIAEEVKHPARTLPLAIAFTLILSTLLYVLVASVAVLAVPTQELAQSKAPLSLVFQRVTGASPLILAAIAIVATLNGIVIQMIMASRVLYGLATQGALPDALAKINPITQTPLIATGLVIAAALVLAVAFPLEGLAEMTSRITLLIFTLVNAALLRIKLRGDPAPAGVFWVPAAVPMTGAAICAGFLVADAIG